MKTAVDSLPTDLESPLELIAELLETVRRLNQLNQGLQNQVEKLLRRIYGPKSEKFDPNQLLLFARELLEAAGVDTATDEANSSLSSEPETPATPPRKNGRGRKPLPKSLPRLPVLHDVPADELPCPDCGAVRTRFGEEVREQLEFIPAGLVVLEHVRPKYACAACRANVVIAERLPEPIEKGLPGPGLLAQIIVSKYADHLPLYRQEGIFRRYGVELSRQTTCDWMATCGELLEPIVKAMDREILKSLVIQTDDTPVPVLDRSPGKTRQGRLRIYLGDRDHPYAVYDYTPNRAGEGPQKKLEGYHGYLQADAYSGYDALYVSGTIIEVGCWAHARRKFDEAKESDPLRAHLALAMIQRLYRVEKDAKELDDAARQSLRQERSGPILEEIHAWLVTEQAKVLPKSPIGEATAYALNHWKALTRYLEHGRLSIDNNASERGMKPVALGRNYAQFPLMPSPRRSVTKIASITMARAPLEL